MLLMVVKMKVMMMESVVSHQSVSPRDGGGVSDGLGDHVVWVILVRMVVKIVIRM